MSQIKYMLANILLNNMFDYKMLHADIANRLEMTNHPQGDNAF